MQNQINMDSQNSQQIGQSPINKSTMIQEKPKINYWMVSTLVLFVTLVVIGIYTVNLKNRQLVDNLNFSVPTPASYSREIPTEAPSQQLTPTPTLSFFEYVVNKGCNYESDGLITEPVENGFCKATIIPCRLQGMPPAYSIKYPSNLSLGTSGGPGLMVLYLGESERLIAGLKARSRDGSMSLDTLSNQLPIGQLSSSFFIDSDATVISKDFLTIGNKRVLAVVLRQDIDGAIKQDKVYMFEDPTNNTLYTVTFDGTNQSGEYLEFIRKIEGVISSMEFIPEKFVEGC